MVVRSGSLALRLRLSELYISRPHLVLYYQKGVFDLKYLIGVFHLTSK